LVVNIAAANLIREAKIHQLGNVMQTSKAAGHMIPNDSLAALVNAKTVEYEEALSEAVDKADLARRFNRSVTEG
jgi:twitching motility protein PilT